MARRKKAPPKKMADQTDCRLLGLLVELRDRTYEMIFCGASHSIPRCEQLSGDLEDLKCPAPGLLLTCKQVHAETMPMYYSQATFCITRSWKLTPQLKRIGIGRQQQISSIHYQISALFSHNTSEGLLRLINIWSGIQHKVLLKAIGQSGAMLGDDKVYIHMYPSGTLMYPTNDSKKVTEMLQESLREMNCVPLHRRLFEELT